MSPTGRWWSALGRPEVVDVIADRRFKNSVRIFMLNDTRPGDMRGSSPDTTPAEEWAELWQDQPRIDMEWLNTGSVWRRLPCIKYSDYNRNQRLSLDDLVILDTVSNGGVSLAKCQPDGTLERYNHGFGFTRTTCHTFMREYARIWVSTGGSVIGRPTDDLFPDVLYRRGYLKKQEVKVPTADETVKAISDIAKAEADLAKAKAVVKQRKKAMKVLDPDKRKRKKKVLPKSAWERLMEDDDG